MKELETKLEEYQLPSKTSKPGNKKQRQQYGTNLSNEKPVYELRKINADLVIKPGKNGWSDYILNKKTKKCHSLQSFPFDYLECPDEHLIRYVSHFSK